MTSLLIGALLVFVLALLHAMIVNSWCEAFRKLGARAPVTADPGSEPVFITVIVPARNAAATLAPLLQDFHGQRHPRERYEVLVIDDHSEDNTAAIAHAMMSRWPQLRVIRLRETKGKKAAITEGVRQAKGELVLVSDADVRSGPDRLKRLAAHWRSTGDELILMPVRTKGEGVLGAIQEEEQLAWLGASAGSAAEGSPVLANGANMAFTKKAFEAVGGFKGDRWASGDDQFLLGRMKKARKRIGFLLDRSVVVEVAAELGWRCLLSQRLRWAGKMRAVGGWGMLAGAFAVLLPWLLIAFTITAAITLSFGQGLVRTWALIMAAWLLWLVPVIALINEVKRALGLPTRSIRSFLALLTFPIYALPVVLLSMLLRPKWRGRQI